MDGGQPTGAESCSWPRTVPFQSTRIHPSSFCLVPPREVDPLPVVLVDKAYWSPLIRWIREELGSGGYIDPEDAGIFRVVETPAEAVDLIQQGIRKPWFAPDTTAAAQAAAQPVSIEGTREGTPIRQAASDVAPPEQKPQQ